MKNTCQYCKYLFTEKTKYENTQECRRYPPTPLISDKWGYTNYFPDVDDNSWCGEFKAK